MTIPNGDKSVTSPPVGGVARNGGPQPPPKHSLSKNLGPLRSKTKQVSHAATGKEKPIHVPAIFGPTRHRDEVSREN